jgi:holo-[acyl-carrier protein] synthase
MNIIGNGVDIVENKRINKLIDDKKFIKRVFTNKEIRFSKNIKNKTNYYAKRFAAKEAFVKALGTGFRNNINFSDIEVINNKLGKPKINISKNVRAFIKKKFKLDKPKIYVSLSDENKHSIAYVILENT